MSTAIKPHSSSAFKDGDGVVRSDNQLHCGTFKFEGPISQPFCYPIAKHFDATYRMRAHILGYFHKNKYTQKQSEYEICRLRDNSCMISVCMYNAAVVEAGNSGNVYYRRIYRKWQEHQKQMQ
jgi:hypothetical protein